MPHLLVKALSGIVQGGQNDSPNQSKMPPGVLIWVNSQNRQLTDIQYNTHVHVHYSQKLKEHVDIMIFIECYPLKRCQGCVKLIASKVNCFLNITDLSEV